MSRNLSAVVDWICKAGVVLLAINEMRGLVLAGPLLYAMYLTGGTAMAIWLGFCSLAGLALSVLVPYILQSKVRNFFQSSA